MAVSNRKNLKVSSLSRLVLITHDAVHLGQFYEQAFGFRHIASDHLSGAAFERLMGIEGEADSVFLRLGQESIELLQLSSPGRPYPADALSSDLIFQHFAIVVTNMAEAFQRLAVVPGWTAISVEGPQQLPASSGGVSAYKFRDPEGHPIELLSFPDHDKPARWRTDSSRHLSLGIDHSAISVSDIAASVRFFQNLGLNEQNRSFNKGLTQEKLDGLTDPRVEVVALAPTQPFPHVELLCYESTSREPFVKVQYNDVAATRLVFEPALIGNAVENILDPDGHRLVILPKRCAAV